MDLIFWLVAGAVVLLVVFKMSGADKKLETPVDSWTDDELRRRLINYVRVRTAAGKLVMSGNLDAASRCADAGAKIRQIE